MIPSILTGLGFTALCTLTSLGLVLWYFDPLTTGAVGQTLLLISLFGSLCSSVGFGLLYWRYRKSKYQLTDFWPSLRQALLISLAVEGFVLLSLYDLGHWWYWPLAFLLVATVEIYLRVKVE